MCVLKREIEEEFPKFLKELKDHYKRAKEEKKAEHSLRSAAPLWTTPILKTNLPPSKPPNSVAALEKQWFLLQECQPRTESPVCWRAVFRDHLERE